MEDTIFSVKNLTKVSFYISAGYGIYEKGGVAYRIGRKMVKIGR